MLHTKIYLLPVSMLAITIASGIITSSSHTLAEDISPVDDTINITVDSACTMGQTTISTNPTINPGETGTIGTSRIAAYCNDANGYDIYAIGYTNGEYGNTDMISTDGNTIHTGTSGEDSYWNVRLTPGTATGQTTHIPTIVSPFDNDTNIPSDYTKVVTYPSTTIPQGTDPTVSGSYFTALYNAHASTTLPAGTYTGQVQYVMVHPVGAPKPEIPYTMQNTALIKRKLTNVGDSLQATDIRDGKTYWVTKEADGNIWMTQNLDLNLDSSKVYTPQDTDITENWTPTRNTEAEISNWKKDLYTPYSFDPGEIYYYTSSNDDEDTTYQSLAACEQDGHENCTHYHAGNYYNWSAAVANNNTIELPEYANASGSICPAGWKLPQISDNNTYNRSDLFNMLISQGGIIGDSLQWTSGFYWAENGFKNIRTNPLWLTRAGYIVNNYNNYYIRLVMTAAAGEYWLGTNGSDTRGEYPNQHGAHGIDFRSSYITGGTNQTRDGLSVRCVAR